MSPGTRRTRRKMTIVTPRSVGTKSRSRRVMYWNIDACSRAESPHPRLREPGTETGQGYSFSHTFMNVLLS